MGAAASAASPISSPRTSPNQKFRRAAALAGGAAAHLVHLRKENSVLQRKSPVVPPRKGPQQSPETPSESEIASQELLQKVLSNESTDFVVLDGFRDAWEGAGHQPMTASAYQLLDSFHMHVKAVVFQPEYCIDTAVGVRVVINEFGVVNMMCSFGNDGANGQPSVEMLKAYVEYSLASIYDLPSEAVIVAPWNPGHVAVLMALESDPSKWDAESKIKLATRFHMRHATINKAVSMFKSEGTLKRLRSLPVSFAVGVLQRAWRRFMKSSAGRLRIETSRRQNNNKDLSFATSPTRFHHNEPLHSTRKLADRAHETQVKTVLEPWWRQLRSSEIDGLQGDQLQKFGTEVMGLLTAYGPSLMTIATNDISVRSGNAVEPSAEALRKSNLDVIGSSSDEPQDEFSDIINTSHLCSAHGNHTISKSTAVLRLRLQGLAAVLRRDLFDARFDSVLQDTIRRVAGVPDDLSVAVLGKRYGSVVVHVGIETKPVASTTLA